MDLGNKTLNGILEVIAAENDLVGYSTYRNRKGHIVVKISYEEPSESDKFEDNNSEYDSERVSFRKMSKAQSRRNFIRAKKFRDQNSSSEKQIEIARSSDLSTTAPDVLDVSQCVEDPCLPESPVTHVTPDQNHSCEAEQFHDVPDSMPPSTPDLVGSKPCELKEETEIRKPFVYVKGIFIIYGMGGGWLRNSL